MKIERIPISQNRMRVKITECDCGTVLEEHQSWASHWRHHCPFNPENDDQ